MSNLNTDFEVRQATLVALGGDPTGLTTIFEVDKAILEATKQGGGVSEQWVRNYTYDKTTIDSKIPSLTGYATQSWVEGKGYLTEHQSLAEYAKKTEVPNIFVGTQEQWDALTDEQKSKYTLSLITE